MKPTILKLTTFALAASLAACALPEEGDLEGSSIHKTDTLPGCDDSDDEPNECPDPEDPTVHYIDDSYDDPMICTVIFFGCEENQTLFTDECGCGCIDIEPDEPNECPDPADPTVHYIGDSHDDPGICGVILFGCEQDQTLFTDECGCGCIDD